MKGLLQSHGKNARHRMAPLNFIRPIAYYVLIVIYGGYVAMILDCSCMEAPMRLQIPFSGSVNLDKVHPRSELGVKSISGGCTASIV